jgi:phage baseplate assembly protein V
MISRDDFQRLIAPVVQRVRLMVSRAVVRLVDSSRRVQVLQAGLLAGETRDNLECFEHYGFTSNPLPGMEAAVMFIGGDRSSGVVVAVGDRQFRLRGLEPGEVALYTDEGDSLVFKRGRTVELSTLHVQISATEDISMATKRFSVTGTESVMINTPALTARGVGDAAATACLEGNGDIFSLFFIT